MKERLNQVGFSMRIRLEWLRYTANLVIAGNDKDTIYNELRNMLKDKLSLESNAKWGSLEKTILILMKIWQNVPSGLEGLRDDGLEFIKTLPPDSTLPIHWGMSMAVYPFFGTVAASVGRLLRLQGSFSISQVQRRLREQYGERETVSRAAHRVIRSFYDWQVIGETGKNGIYSSAGKKKISNVSLIFWLIESVLHTSIDLRGNFKEIVDSPCLFPFNLDQIVPGQLNASGRIEVIKHNLDEDLIFIKK
ncbi:MAG: hypothetical protein JSV88_32695 [Candidatus Aminicenantes bacterium]|nr:MAG: hypothetical protein JSV88_32695 [Candidatus Aminicenantes bacterium]